MSTHSATAQPQNPDMTHVIHKLCFGDRLQVSYGRGSCREAQREAVPAGCSTLMDVLEHVEKRLHRVSKAILLL